MVYGGLKEYIKNLEKNKVDLASLGQLLWPLAMVEQVYTNWGLSFSYSFWIRFSQNYGGC